MGNHYLPQFYLQGFADNNRLWAFDKKNSKYFFTQAKVVANENSMYTDELEQYFANKIEDPAKEAITRIRAGLTLTPQHRDTLAAYIIALWKRVPTGRERMKRNLPEVADFVRARISDRIDSIAREEKNFTEIAKKRRDEVDLVIERYKANPPDHLWHSTFDIETTPRMIRALRSMTWTLLTSREKQFITCDNPVFFFETDGIGQQNSELTIPFGSEVALWAHRKAETRAQYVAATNAMILELNRRTARNARRFLYSKHEEPWLLKFAKKEHVPTRLH